MGDDFEQDFLGCIFRIGKYPQHAQGKIEDQILYACDNRFQ